MSYDVTICEMDDKGPTGYVWEFNYTTNLSGVLRAAKANPLDWNGRTGKEVSTNITRAIDVIRSNRLCFFQIFGPWGEWGDIESLLVFLTKIDRVCYHHPTAIVRANA